ncbi:response regulator [Nannocystis bainbridge]|uniref:histidine kinase n=1 Tax=Nannocystis bainbridge TaxID=2995303 RepID=A0ABT5EAE7_9BACT|nr:response regulator [Nannocystis bainbridge]MDC0722812.1 response regulator [Nannocystis bainbridge]
MTQIREAQRRSLTKRLTVAIATPIALLLFLGVVLGRQILLMADDAAWVNHSNEVLSLANATMLEVVDQETALRGYLLTADRQYLAPFERANPGDKFERLQALVADDPTQQAQFEQAHARYQSWLTASTAAQVSSDLEYARSSEGLRDRKSRMDGVREAMTAALDVERDLLTARAVASERSTAIARNAFVLLLAGVAVLLAFLSRRQLAAIASTFGSALDAEQQARVTLEGEAWVREGHTRIAEAMQGEKSTAQVGRDCLTALATHVGADVGAFFVRDGAGWARRAALGLDTRIGGPETFAAGEGVVGRAADDGRIVELSDGSDLPIRSGTSERAPSHVYVTPARIDRVSVAVLEIGFLRPPRPQVLDLLARIGETVALAVRSSEHKERLAALLQETQRQAEELQTQQEELRVQNEELEQQTRALEESRARLGNQQAELEQINAHLEEQTQALQSERDSLTQAQVQLRRTSAFKSEFLANMSHELRTPLNSSLILARLLADNRQGNLDAEQIKFAETIYSAGNDLLTLINDILDLSKIEAGMLDVRPEAVTVARLTDQLATTFRPIARDRRLALDIEVQRDAPPALHTDSTRLAQILRNLLSNALKFTEQGGVSLTVRAAGAGNVAFAVTDTGIGIPADQQEMIFEAFRQADGTTNRKYGGTGLGLSISRDLARLLGGELTVASAVGRGSTFTLTIPAQLTAPGQVTSPALAPTTGPALPLPPAAPPAPPPLRRPPAAKPPAPTPATDTRSILVIEDDPAFATVLAGLARELEFQALLADTAEAGLELARQHRPSAIVLDVQLPDRSGLTVLDALKHDPNTRHIPVHVISASDHTRTALEMGAVAYAIKPVVREQLVDALRRLESKATQSLRRVLVVEDDLVHRESTCKLLAGDDVETVPVGTAADALAALRTTTFDCMVLDLSLPDRSGFELLQEMAQGQQYGFPPVIVYTGRAINRAEEQELGRFSQSIIIKGARSPERLLDEVTLFLHQVETSLPPERQRMLRDARHRDAVFEGRRVLVVEDDVRNVFALTSVLEPRGAKVEIARNGKEALAHLRSKPGVDLILMDLMMPEMDGLTATRAIRADPATAKIPIIALTAKAMADDRASCLAAGANDYIAKPLDVDKLLSLARVWMPK